MNAFGLVALLGCSLVSPAQPAAPQTYRDEPFVLEHSDVTVRMKADGTGERLTHIVIRVQSEGVARQFSVLDLPYAFRVCVAEQAPKSDIRTPAASQPHAFAQSIYNPGMGAQDRLGSARRTSVSVIDSHTEGEPTRVVLGGAPLLEGATPAQKRDFFRNHHDAFRSSIVLEPRGSEAIVGALLLEPLHPESTAGVIFFNDVGTIGMCGHGTIGLVATLAHLGRIAPGVHRIETPVGIVSTQLHANGRVSVENVPSYRYRAAVAVEVPHLGQVCGDIAWGGNWFFLVDARAIPALLLSGETLHISRRAALLTAAVAIRSALSAAGITGADGAMIDHVEFFAAPNDPENSARNFVLCPGAAFDRSPCGTGTSAKMACLHAEGKLRPGETWWQEGILGTVFEGSIEELETADAVDPAATRIVPTITGYAWITAEATLLFDPDDPFASGIRMG